MIIRFMAPLMLAVVPMLADAQTVAISKLPAATSPSGTEVVPAVQGGSTVKLSLDQIVARSQPLDDDLTAIAALTTTATGRDLLTAADAASIRSKAGLGTAATANTGTSGATVPLLNGANTWATTQTFNGAITGAMTIQTSTGVIAYVGTDGAVNLGSSSIEVGRTGRTAAGNAFIDWHSSAASPDYDVRLISTGGTTTSGQGALSVLASTAAFSGFIIQSTAFTPASSTATCTTGQMAWDASYEYRCVATNSWKRVALAAW